MVRLTLLKFPMFILISIVLFLCACMNKAEGTHRTIAMNKGNHAVEMPVGKKKKLPSEEFKRYWYAGDAEITSYKLEQARYGETRNGTSVLIYVTEPFLPKKQVKADRSSPGNIPVLKLNATKKYLTGIYPYSIMSSTFYPVHDDRHAIKTSLSVQEWCGHVYSQINDREKFDFTSHSYFETEADEHLSLEKEVLENEIWTKIRINPKALPIGNLKMIPSLEYIRLRHREPRAYDATASLTKGNGTTSYTIFYPELERTLTINFASDFPYAIEDWSEEFKSGVGPNAKAMTTKATRLKSIKTVYWQQNGNDDVVLRDSLGL